MREFSLTYSHTASRDLVNIIYKKHTAVMAIRWIEKYTKIC